MLEPGVRARARLAMPVVALHEAPKPPAGFGGQVLVPGDFADVPDECCHPVEIERRGRRRLRRLLQHRRVRPEGRGWTRLVERVLPRQQPPGRHLAVGLRPRPDREGGRLPRRGDHARVLPILDLAGVPLQEEPGPAQFRDLPAVGHRILLSSMARGSSFARPRGGRRPAVRHLRGDSASISMSRRRAGRPAAFGSAVPAQPTGSKYRIAYYPVLSILLLYAPHCSLNGQVGFSG